MNKQIWSLLDNFRGALDAHDFIVQIAACFVWFKQTGTKVIDVQDRFDASIGPATMHMLPSKLEHAVGKETIFLPDRRGKLSGEQIYHLMRGLQDLLKAQLVTYKDLSDTLRFSSAGFGKSEYLPHVPNELASLGIKLLGEKTESVYCPFDTGYYFASELPSSSEKKGEAIETTDLYFAEVDKFLLDSNFSIVQNDPIQSPYYVGDGGLVQFDASIAMPPFGLNIRSKEINDIWGRFPEKSLMGEVYFLRHMLAHTFGTVVCFVANGFLFRTAAGEKQFKQDVVNHNMVKAVISLPANLLAKTGIPISILVLDKSKTCNTIKFIDASSDVFTDKSSRTRNRLININRILEAYNSSADTDISVHASPQQVKDNEYNLSPGRYVLSENYKELTRYLSQFETARLEELVEIVRPQALKHSESGEEIYCEYNLSNLDDIGFIQGEGKKICVGQNDIAKAKKQIIKANDVLVVCKGAVGKVGLAGEEIEPNAIASQSFSILRVKPHISSTTAEALYQYLASKYGQLQLSSLATGTSALMLSAKDLNTLEVPLFTIEKLNQIKAVRQQIIDTNKQIQNLKSDIKRLNHSWL
ncbi:N-6 DNA methylase [Neptunomonas sp.]|uniref:N-6 DNA methylase n=1 Tax=Neptunomonas sp. TaxID=1971898 RepID=UPI003567D14B